MRKSGQWSVVSGQSQKGFTLMELLVVIVLLGILVTLGLTSFTSSQRKGRDLRRKSDLRQISVALETYYTDKGKYSNSTSGKIMGCGSDDRQECSWESQFVDKNNTIYLPLLPGDPAGNRTYYYLVGASNKSYQLYAALENTLDIDLPKDAQNKVRTYSDLNCGTTTTLYCNYGVASGNTSPDTGRAIIYQ